MNANDLTLANEIDKVVAFKKSNLKEDFKRESNSNKEAITESKEQFDSLIDYVINNMVIF